MTRGGGSSRSAAGSATDTAQCVQKLPDDVRRATQTHVDDLCSLEQARFDLARELFLGEDWDHFFVLFSSTDWLGHALTGRFLNGDQEAREALIRLYSQLDSYIGWLLDNAPDASRP